MSRGRDKFYRYKKVINIISFLYGILPNRMQNNALVRHRKQTGSIGLVIRYAILKNLAKHIGDNVSIYPDVYLFNVKELSIGDNVSIHPMCYIEAFGGVSIGNDVSIAHGVTIMSAAHGFDDVNIPIKEQKVSARPISIENNIWIGAKATILGGNAIGSGSIIGAGAVVTKDVEKNTIVAGVPAKLVRRRKE